MIQLLYNKKSMKKADSDILQLVHNVVGPANRIPCLTEMLKKNNPTEANLKIIAMLEKCSKDINGAIDVYYKAYKENKKYE